MVQSSDAQLVGGHGGQGSTDASFSRLLAVGKNFIPLKLSDPDRVLNKVAEVIGQAPDPIGPQSDGPDDQENPFVPAGYTYLGQFIDHDLTFDTLSSLNTAQTQPNNVRTPRLDLDCLYGLGPDAAPFMYDADGRLLTNIEKPFDLPRASQPYKEGDVSSHRAIIGDPRNDENSIVCQLQLAFIQFHNTLIDKYKSEGLKGGDLFEAARREVRLTYQNIVVTDFLKRIIDNSLYDKFIEDHQTSGSSAYNLYVAGSRNALPLEFTGAAYRFGHSGVRNNYRLNTTQENPLLIFDSTDLAGSSLVGFGDLPVDHAIDWKLFLSGDLKPGESGDNSNPEINKARLQYAYKLDTSLVDPLLHLPTRIGGTVESLAFRNLRRGYGFQLPSGQDIARIIGAKDPPLRFGEKLLTFGQLGLSDEDAKALEENTPLWLYVLAEAQVSFSKNPVFEPESELVKKDANVGTQLGQVGGRILLEVFFGILDDDQTSYFHAKDWDPVVKPGAKAVTLWDILHFIGKV